MVIVKGIEMFSLCERKIDRTDCPTNYVGNEANNNRSLVAILLCKTGEKVVQTNSLDCNDRWQLVYFNQD